MPEELTLVLKKL